jgi:hypothetical protein
MQALKEAQGHPKVPCPPRGSGWAQPGPGGAQYALSPPPHSGLPLLAAADLQDHLMVASNDLERLQRLLDNASMALIGHLTGATRHLDAVFDAAHAADPVSMQEMRLTLDSAITALQFQDLATQLIAHTSQRLRSCVDRLGRDVFADDDGDDDPGLVALAPQRPNPVTQDEMDAGSVELF